MKRSLLVDTNTIKRYIDCYNVAKEYVDLFIEKYYNDNFDNCKDSIMLLEELIKKKYNIHFENINCFIKYMIFIKKFQTRKDVIYSKDLEYLNKTFIRQFIKNIDKASIQFLPKPSLEPSSGIEPEKPLPYHGSALPTEL